MYTEISMTDLVESATRLDGQAFKDFMFNVVSRRVQEQKAVLKHEESVLLTKINAGFPALKWERLAFLDEKSEHETLSADEQHERSMLINAYEAYSLKRLKLIGKLAALRKQSLSEVMLQLGIGAKGCDISLTSFQFRQQC